MGALTTICFVALVCSCYAQKYTTKFDDIDVDMILSNRRVLNNYIKCILDEGPCTPDGREFKSNLPEAISTNCNRCSEAQVRIVRKVAPFIMKNRASDWERISVKFDPQGKYKTSFLKFLEGH